MDLETLDLQTFASKGAPFQLLHPATRKPTGLWVRLIGRDSDEYKTWSFARADQKAEEDSMRKRRRQAVVEVSATDIYEDQLAEGVFFIREWWEADEKGNRTKGTWTLGASELDFTPENVEATLRRFTWILEQVNAGASNRSLFFDASAPN